MGEKLTAIILAGMICLVGCSRSYQRTEDGTQRTEDRGQRTALSSDLSRPSSVIRHPSSAPVAAMERMRADNLPAVRDIAVWENPYGPGLELTTDHYRIRTTLLEPLMLRSVPSFIEAAFQSYNDQLPQPIESALKFDVYLFGDRQQWEEFTRSFAGGQAPVFCKIKTGAYYLNGACVVYDIGRSRTLAALGHEGWHQFNSRHFKYRLPSWLDEGVAMLFEESACEQGTFCFVPQDNVQRLGALSTIFNSGGQIPLAELIATSPGQAIATDQAGTVMAFYSQSYALVRFLREADGGKYLAGYQQMLWDGLSGRWPLDEAAERTAEDRNLPRTSNWNRLVGPALFARYIGGDFDRLQQEYDAYCRQILKGKSFAWNDEAGLYQCKGR